MSQSSSLARERAVAIHEEDAGKFESWYREADRCASAFLYGRSTMERFFRHTLNYLGRNAKVLDVGCGVGEQMLCLEKLGHDVYGVDPAHAMVSLAAQKIPGKVSEGSILELPFDDGSFDMVYSFEVFRYLSAEDNVKGLQEVLRVLRPGGIFFSSFVNRFALDGFYCLHQIRRALRRSRCHHEFETPNRLETKLSDIGFVQVETYGSMFGFLRVVYKFSPKFAAGLARRCDGLDWLSNTKFCRPFSGHLMATARKKLGN